MVEKLEFIDKQPSTGLLSEAKFVKSKDFISISASSMINGEISIPLLKEAASRFNFGSGAKKQMRWNDFEMYPNCRPDEIAQCHSLVATRLAMQDPNLKKGTKLQDHIKFKQMNLQMALTIAFLNKGINLIRNGLYEEACFHFSDSKVNWKLGTYLDFSDCYIRKDSVRDWSDFTELESFQKESLYAGYTLYYRSRFGNREKKAKEEIYLPIISLSKLMINKDLYLESLTDPKIKAGLDYLRKEVSLVYLEEWLHHLQFLNSIRWSETTNDNCLMSESKDQEEDIARIFMALDLNPPDNFFDRYISRKGLKVGIS